MHPNHNWLANTIHKTMRIVEERMPVAGTDTIKYDEQATHHFFFGDETALDLFNRYKQVSLQRDKEYFGVVELTELDMHLPEEMRLLIDSVVIDPDYPAVAAIQWMEEMHPDCWESWKDATFYLAGRATAVQRFCQYLRQRNVPMKKMRLLETF